MKITKQELKKIIREELEQINLQDLQPEVDALYDVVQREIDKIPESARDVVLQTLSEKISTKPNQAKENNSRPKMMSDRPVGNPEFPEGHPFYQNK